MKRFLTLLTLLVLLTSLKLTLGCRISHATGRYYTGTVCSGAGYTGMGYYNTTLKAGDIVTFGRYEQDNRTSNGKEEIEWRVLETDERNGRVLLVSLYGLDTQPFDTTRSRVVTWESCTLRRWLNNEFLNSAFTGEEQSAILTSYHGDEDSSAATQWLSSPAWDRQAKDKVFLLSYHDADRLYFYETTSYGSLMTSDRERRCGITEYAAARGALVSHEHDVNGRPTGRWWLRTPRTLNGRTYDIYLVRSGGDIDIDGASAKYMAVRPAVWVSISAVNRK